MEELIKGLEAFWKKEPDIDEHLWRAVAKSYIEKDQDLEEQRIFITQISFYPQLINTLVNVLEDKKDKNPNYEISLKITFFSSLLPRHYWNFPLEYKDENNIRIDAPEFLDTYRKSIEECVNTAKSISVQIERVLIVSSGDERNVDGNTILFSEKDLDNDKKYLPPKLSENKISWKNFLGKEKTFKDRHLIDICDLSQTKESYKGKKNEKSSLYLLELKNPRNNKRESLYDYYVNKLHSKGLAKLLIVCPDSTAKTLIKKGYCREKTLEGISPNLSIINIKIKNKELNENKEFEYLLDTYMDLKMGIVRLQIIDLKENIGLKNKIYSIHEMAKNIITTGCSCHGHSRKCNKNLNGLINKIEAFAIEPGNEYFETLSREVINKLNSNLSNEILLKILQITKKRVINMQLLTELNQMI